MFSFSPTLINKTIEYFRKECGIDISPETAMSYLASMADLFSGFEKCRAEDGGPKARRSDAG